MHMKINIIGAGPAGLYTGISLKQLDNLHDVTIIERNSREAKDGLGYVLQPLALQQLREIDANFAEGLEGRVTDPWASIEIGAKGILGTLDSWGLRIGIQRSSLLDYLRELAEEAGIDIKYGMPITTADIDRYKEDSDILVGADGVHSIVRERYTEEFGASTMGGTNSYIWLTNNKPDSIMRHEFSEYNNFVFMYTSYPIDESKCCVIVECTREGLQALGLDKKVQQDGTISQTGLELLTELFQKEFIHMPFYDLNLESHNSQWRQHQFNTCDRFYTGNVALVGESAVSVHYMLGIGLPLAFGAAKNLALELSTKNPNKGLAAYNKATSRMYKDAKSFSLSEKDWLESINQQYASLGGLEFIKALLTIGRGVKGKIKIF